MATKKKRTSKQNVSAGTPRSYSELYKGQSTLPEAAATTAATAATAAATAAVLTEEKVNWTQEYDYVYRDLRYLGIVSAALLLAMLVIGFFI